MAQKKADFFVSINGKYGISRPIFIINEVIGSTSQLGLLDWPKGNLSLGFQSEVLVEARMREKVGLFVGYRYNLISQTGQTKMGNIFFPFYHLSSIHEFPLGAGIYLNINKSRKYLLGLHCEGALSFVSEFERRQGAGSDRELILVTFQDPDVGLNYSVGVRVEGIFPINEWSNIVIGNYLGLGLKRIIGMKIEHYTFDVGTQSIPYDFDAMEETLEFSISNRIDNSLFYIQYSLNLSKLIKEKR